MGPCQNQPCGICEACYPTEFKYTCVKEELTSCRDIKICTNTSTDGHYMVRPVMDLNGRSFKKINLITFGLRKQYLFIYLYLLVSLSLSLCLSVCLYVSLSLSLSLSLWSIFQEGNVANIWPVKTIFIYIYSLSLSISLSLFLLSLNLSFSFFLLLSLSLSFSFLSTSLSLSFSFSLSLSLSFSPEGLNGRSFKKVMLLTFGL
ncbi:unnamed protein product [Acanthosepion pharaonis]|uniref:Uncharacterized protein n=1 Tax=Acanthosepion pharaonis TaxID=158019 RepID=A0A812D1C7_ACAPH|nr:unnamed protein product [Sepia pharaonis]